MRRRTRPAAALLLVALIGVSCGGGDDDPPRRSGASSTTSTAPDGATTTAAPDDGSTTTTRPGATTRPGGGGGDADDRDDSGEGTGSGDEPADDGPRSLGPAPPGSYLYGTTGTVAFGLGGTSPLPAVTSLVIEPPAGTRQQMTRSLRDAAGNGPATELVLDYRPDGVHLVQITLSTTAFGITDSRLLRPQGPSLLVPTEARAGTRLDLILSGSGITADAVIEILDGETVYVGGQAVAAVVVRMSTSIRPGELSGRMELTLWASPEHKLWVKERSMTDATAGLIRYQSQYEAILQRLTPT